MEGKRKERKAKAEGRREDKDRRWEEKVRLSLTLAVQKSCHCD